MSRDWTFYLEDIRDSARKISEYSRGMTFESFRDNELVFDAVVRNLEILGEAAKHLPAEARALMPDVEWAKAAAFRDIIAHHYFGLNVEIIWDVVRNKIPGVLSASESLLSRLCKSQGDVDS